MGTGSLGAVAGLARWEALRSDAVGEEEDRRREGVWLSAGAVSQRDVDGAVRCCRVEPERELRATVESGRHGRRANARREKMGDDATRARGPQQQPHHMGGATP